MGWIRPEAGVNLTEEHDEQHQRACGALLRRVERTGPRARRRSIAELWAEDGALFTPSLAVRSHGAIETRVAGAYEKWVKAGGLVFESANTADGHRDTVRSNWEMVPAAGGGRLRLPRLFGLRYCEPQSLMSFWSSGLPTPARARRTVRNSTHCRASRRWCRGGACGEALGQFVFLRCGYVIRARLLARAETTLPRRRRPRSLARCAHRPVRDVRR
jgi:hypothetical protein